MKQPAINFLRNIAKNHGDSCVKEFEKYELKTLEREDFNEPFLWCAYGASFTSFCQLNEFDLEEQLSASEAKRFCFFRDPIQWIAGSIIYHLEHWETCDLYYYDGKEFHKLRYTSSIYDVVVPIAYRLRDKFKELHPNEFTMIHEKIPVRFRSKEAFSQFQSLVRTDKSGTLTDCARTFHRHLRCAINEEYVISREGDKSFYFEHYVNGKFSDNGGIIHHEGKWSKHT